MAPKFSKSTKKKKKAIGKVKGVHPPRDLADTVDLADWLELVALKSQDRNASKADLLSLLKLAGNSQLSAEQLALAVFAELESRRRAAASSYPFTITPPKLRVRADAVQACSPYVFCLCLSAWRWKYSKERPENARQLFEDLSCSAARTFLGGKVFRFAHPRESGFSNFGTAVEHVCAVTGEGIGFAKRLGLDDTKDDALDVVAWRESPDGRFGKLVLFGQCASGRNWKEKRGDLNVNYFGDMWFQRPFTVDCIKALFIPHRLRTDDWEATARKAGIPFDRCRVAYWAHKERVLPKKAEFVSWAKSALSKH